MLQAFTKRFCLLTVVMLLSVVNALAEDADVIEIGTVDQLKTFRDKVNNGDNYAGKTVLLTEDLDLSGENWTPIGLENREYSFLGIFDGQNHTISNLTINQSGSVGLFYHLRGTIKNLTLTDVDITGTYQTGAFAAYCPGLGTIENCHVIGGTITSTPVLNNEGKYDDGNNVGGIIGNMDTSVSKWDTTASSIKGCSVKNVTIRAYRRIGGIAGLAQTSSAENGKTTSITGCTVENVTILQDNTHPYKNYTQDSEYEIGELVGRKGVIIEENNHTNVTIKMGQIFDETTYVAQIDNEKYETLQAAIADVPADGTETTITMLADAAANTGVTIAANQNIVLELNGKVISVTTNSTKSYALITNKGTLTINDNTDTNKDGTGTGKITTTATDPDGQDWPGYASNTITNNGTLIINSGYIENSTTNAYAAYTVDNVTNGNLFTPTFTMNGGKLYNGYTDAIRQFLNSTDCLNKVVINGGVIASAKNGRIVVFQNSNAKLNKGELDITGGTILGNVGGWSSVNPANDDYNFTDEQYGAISINISGGTMNAIVFADYMDNATLRAQAVVVTGGTYSVDPTIYVAEGYEAVDNGNETWTVKKATAKVAKIGETEYATLAAAFEAAQANDKIELINDATIEGTGTVITVDKILTLDLKGYKVINKATAGRPFTIAQGGNLTIDGTAEGSGFEIPSENTNSYGFFRIDGEESILTVNGGSFTGNTDNGAFFRVGDYAGATVNLTHLSAETNYRFVACGNYTWSELNVTGGNYTHNNKDVRSGGGVVPAFYLAGFESVFDGVTITSQIGSCVEVAGYKPYTKGTFRNNSFKVLGTSVDQSWNNVALAVDTNGEVLVESGTYEGEGYGLYIFTSGGDVTINGGTFKGGTASIKSDFDDYTYGKYGWSSKVTITNGFFDGKLSTNGSGNAAILVSGGVFTSAVPADFCAAGYEPASSDNATYPYTVKAIDYTIVNYDVNGNTVTANKNTAIVGEEITLTISTAAGYSLKSLSLNGGAQLEAVESNKDQRTFVMPAANVTISAEFVQNATESVETIEEATIKADEEGNSTATITNVEIAQEGVKNVTVSAAIGSAEVTEIAEGAFASLPNTVQTIDLSSTQVALEGERSDIEVLSAIPENVLVYLPSTSSVSGTNVVIKAAENKYTCESLFMEDQNDYSIPQPFTAETATLQREFTADKPSTLCLPYDVPAGNINDKGKIYRFKSIDLSACTITMTEDADGLDANVPYIFMPKAGTTSISVSSSDSDIEVKMENPQTTQGTFTFVGVFEKKVFTADESNTGVYGYAGQKQDGYSVGQFAKAGEGAHVAGMRAYLIYTGGESLAPGLNGAAAATSLPSRFNVKLQDANGETTEILNLDMETAEDGTPVYNLSGQCVNNPEKGIYIKNGKKVIIK